MEPQIVNSQLAEFGYELLTVIPYAYYLHTSNQLTQTISGKHTKDWYFFSKNHVELDIPRHGLNNGKLKVPNKAVHKPFNLSQWKFPNYQKNFFPIGKKLFNFQNLVIISNKYNIEWGQPPVNYIHSNTLDVIFDYLTKQNYTIIYNRLTSDLDYDDGVEQMPLGDFNLIKNKYPNVYTIQNLMNEYNLNLNELTLRLYPLCKKFISVQGGTSIISSMFGGENIMLVNKGFETISGIYHKIFPLMSQSKLNIIGAFQPPGNILLNFDKSQQDLIKAVKKYY